MYDQMIDPPAAAKLEAGTIVDERYRVEQRIGRGGMGVVYRAEQLSLRVPVALKVMRRRTGELRLQRCRFRREAKLTASITSPHVVRVFDCGTHGPLDYSVMEYLRGDDLATFLRPRGRLPWRTVREILLQATRGLQAAYERGILHRDLKPSNMFLVRPRRAEVHLKLLDFGLAKSVDPSCSSGYPLTHPDVVMGTVRYLAPERGRGTPASIRSEIYSLGLIAYECISGRVPLYARNAVRMLMRRARESPPSARALVPELPRAVDELLVRAMQPDPRRRFGSLEELEAAVLATPRHAQEPEESTRSPAGRRHPVSPAALASTCSWSPTRHRPVTLPWGGRLREAIGR